MGAARAYVRGEGVRAGRALLVECEIAPGGRSRMLVNRQPVRRARDGLDHLRAVVFARDLKMTDDEIYSDHDVRFRFGPSHGSGREMRIALLPAQAGAKK